MPRGAAGADDETSCLEQAFPVVYDARELDGAEFGVETALHRGLEGARLLEYFLEHEVREAALLYFAEAHFELVDDRGLLHAAKVGNPELFAFLYEGYLLFVEINYLVGVFNDGGGVGANEIFALSYAYDEWAALARGNHGVRPLLVYNHEGVCPYDVP